MFQLLRSLDSGWVNMLNREFLAPEADLLEPVDIGAFVRCQIWNIEFLVKVSILIFNLDLRLYN